MINVINRNPELQLIPKEIIDELTNQLGKKEWFVSAVESNPFNNFDFNFSEFGEEIISVFRYKGTNLNIDLYICPLY